MKMAQLFRELVRGRGERGEGGRVERKEEEGLGQGINLKIWKGLLIL